ncbi:MAG: hypothetical protein KL863_05295 [Rhizobium sp.]|nr:hypothetical protein [Rhizobium sp.]
MATERIVIGERQVDRAIRMTEEGTPDGKPFIFSDDRVTGLQLRVQGKKATWVLRYYGWTKTIATLHPQGKRQIKAATEARKLATACKEVLDDDPALFENFLTKRFGTAGSDKAAKLEAKPKITTWNLQQCCDFVIEERGKPNADNKIGKDSIDDWRRTLRRPEMMDVINVPVAALTRGKFDTIKRLIEQAAGVSPSKKMISHVRSILSYCCLHASDESGLDDKNQWWEMLKSGKKLKRRTRAPSPREIAKTLLLAEEYLNKPLPGRDDYKHGVRENVYAAFWWLMLTAQRTYAALHIKRTDLFPDTRQPGWYIAYWGPDVMKAGKEHMLPIPPRVAQFLLPILDNIKRETESEWLFASERGSEENDITVNRSAVLGLLKRLAAKDIVARPKGSTKIKPGCVDLMARAGVTWWTPHDSRRSITDVMDDEGIPGGASVVLAHEIKLTNGLNEDALTEEQREEWLAARMAKITKLAYGNAKHLKLKSKAMEAWTNAVLDEYERLKGLNVVSFPKVAA